MGIYDDLAKLDQQSPSPKADPASRLPKNKKQKESSSVPQPIGQSTNQPIGQSTNQSTSQSIDPLLEIEQLGPIVERPRAFYITQKLDQWLDEAVRGLKETGLHKIDRSVLVNGLLHDPDLFKIQYLEGLRKRFLAHLTNKSLKRTEFSEDE